MFSLHHFAEKMYSIPFAERNERLAKKEEDPKSRMGGLMMKGRKRNFEGEVPDENRPTKV